MRKILILILLIYSASQNFSQVRISQDIFLFPQGNPIGELSSSGMSGLFSNVSNIGSINPAALSNFENLSFGFSYQLETKISEAWIANIGYKRNSDFLPQSIGLIYPYKNYRLGLSFRQRYNGIMNIDPIPVTTTQYPNGTGEFTDFQEKVILYDYSIIASYTFQDIIDLWNLSVGGNISIENMTEDANGYYNFSLHYNGNRWTGGIMIEKKYGINKHIQFGLTYESNINLQGLEGGLAIIPNIDSTYKTSYYIVIESYAAQFPARLKFDFDISTIPSIKFLGSISNIFRKNTLSSNPNEFEYAGSVVYTFSDNLSSSLGFYSTRKTYDPIMDRFYNTNKNMQAFFLIFGSSLEIDNIQVNFSLADSHLFSGEWRKQTIGKFGIGYNF